MISFTPLFLVVTAFVLLHESPSLIGIAGIVTIVTGSYVLNLSSAHRGWADPFRAILKTVVSCICSSSLLSMPWRSTLIR